MTRWRYAAVNDAGRIIGENHHSAKLSDADVELIHELKAAGLSAAQVAAKFDDDVRVAKSTVLMIWQGLRRSQTVMGHRRLPAILTFSAAGIDEFELC